MQRSRIPRGQQGFTIVELLVVITIIGMLMAITMPALGLARDAVKRAQCIHRQKELASTIIFVATNKDGRMPVALPTVSGTKKTWVIPLLSSIDGGEGIHDQIMAGSFSGDFTLSALICPADPPKNSRGTPLSYVANCGRNNGPEKIANGSWSIGDGTNSIPCNISDIKSGDGVSRTALLSEYLEAKDWNRNSPSKRDAGIYWEGGRPSSNHAGGFVMAFCGGNVEFISDQISDETFGRLLTSNGKETGVPWQAVPITEDDLDP